MKQTKAPKSTPSPQSGEPQSVTNSEGNPTSIFISMALDMSWRLAIVVLLPIIGGFKLDEAFDSAPILTIIGFCVAAAGVALVLWRTLKVANEVSAKKDNKS
jgi:F0F1-type ATP synthase assembly protein I